MFTYNKNTIIVTQNNTMNIKKNTTYPPYSIVLNNGVWSV